ILSIRIAKSTVAPINELSDKLSKVDFSKPRNTLHMGEDGDELYDLERNYDEMLDRLYKLMEENNQNMETQRKLEIDALQMQINPHFLYNTLDAIAWMAKIKKQADIEKLVINLAKFFRLSLHKGDKYITIAEETELVEHFLEIEKIRFPNTINYVCNLPNSVKEYKTLKLILQPIVENCIKHGFANNSGAGTITVSAEEKGNDIVISVTDDGCGFDVPQDFWTKKSDKPNGYGLYNVNERIRLEYGEGYGLNVTSQVGVGTTVTATIKKQV
ncbi:MAG: sensor histidine kinase, partial [Clostridia bacterium]|nr:sensor histidine kinase [Clostridia bacterium]